VDILNMHRSPWILNCDRVDAFIQKCHSLYVAITVFHLPLVNEDQRVQKTFKGNKHVNAVIS
jgi:hypothetical protein